MVETHMVFVDYIKAFNNVRQNKLWNIMDRRIVLKHLIDVIKSMYKDTEIIVKTESGEVLSLIHISYASLPLF